MSERYTLDDLEKLGAKWVDRIRTAEKREERWIKDAEAAEKAYLCDTGSDAQSRIPDFNILHSNVETIVPSIYNSTALPDIRPRQGSLDPIAKMVADTYEGAIRCMTDDNKLDAEIEESAQDAFMAGRGVVRVKFDADVDGDTVTGESVLYEVVSWRDYRFGPCKRFSDRPWEAFRHCVSRESLEEVQDADIEALYVDESDDEKDDYWIWEIWCRDTGKVYFVADETSKVYSVKDDPLGLNDFYTVKMPIQPIKASGKTIPVCPYTVYQTLAEELDSATQRINAIMKGLKVRGLIVGDAGVLDAIADLQDNQLATVGNMESLVAMGGLDKAVMWWPIDTAVMVLKELYAQREITKQAIYEITGISDIVRGASQAAETATAQQIKTQWGSLRIKKMQRLVERQARDLFSLTVEIMSKHFSTETLLKLSGVELPKPPPQPQRTGDVQKDTQAVQQYQQAAMQAQQAAKQYEQLLRDPLAFYRVDVESNSTVRADVANAQEQMGGFLDATGKFFSVMAPLIQQAPAMAEPIAEIWGSFADKYNLGKRAEDALAKMVDLAKQAAQNPPPNPEAEAMKMEQQAKQAEMQMKGQELQMKGQELQAKMRSEGQKAQLEVQKAQADLQGKGVDLQIKQVELQLKQAELGLKADELRLKESVAEVDAQVRVAELDQQEAQAEAERKFASQEARATREHGAAQADADRKQAAEMARKKETA